MLFHSIMMQVVSLAHNFYHMHRFFLVLIFFFNPLPNAEKSYVRPEGDELLRERRSPLLAKP